MSDAKPPVGTIGWLDLTVDDAPRVREFYSEVVGWTPHAVPMGEYEDWAMGPPEGKPVAGVCHRRGGNADQPLAWVPYIIVENLEASLEAVERLGGEVAVPARTMGESSFAVIRDPAGAICALYQP